jgi:predicted site-specific integrase-resolvase
MIDRNCFPMLLRRKHFIEKIGINNSLYYQLINSGAIPTVTINKRKYILRDDFFDALENNTIPFLSEV